jgi:NADH-quinone oxidoreductase subunit J
MNLILLLLLSITVGISVGVVTAATPIVAILLLVIVFLLTGLSFAILGAEFLSMLFILVYTGAIGILFLFIIMCTRIGKYTTLFDWSNKIKTITLTTLLLFLLPIAHYISYKIYPTFSVNDTLYIELNESWENLLIERTDIVSIGDILYFFYPLPIILIGVILLISLVGSMHIALFHSNKVRRQDTYPKEIVSFKKVINFIRKP